MEHIFFYSASYGEVGMGGSPPSNPNEAFASLIKKKRAKNESIALIRGKNVILNS